MLEEWLRHKTTEPGVSSIYQSQSRSCSSKYPSQWTSRYLFFPDKPGISQRRTSSSPTGLPISCPFLCISRLAGTRSTSYTVTGIYPKRSRPHFPARFSRPSPPPQLYHMAPSTTTGGSWSSSYLPSPQRVSRVTLVLSSGSPHRNGLPPPLATLDSLPEVVEVHRGLSPSGSYRSPDSRSSRVHTARLASRFPPRRGQADCLCTPSLLRLLPGTFRMSLCVLSKDDHVPWTPTLVHGESPSDETHPTARFLLLTGLLRGLWDFDSAEDLCDIDIFLPDQSLVKSLSTPPSTFSNEVVELLHDG